MPIFDDFLKSDFALSNLIATIIQAHRELTTGTGNKKRTIEFLEATLSVIGMDRCLAALEYLKNETP